MVGDGGRLVDEMSALRPSSSEDSEAVPGALYLLKGLLLPPRFFSRPAPIGRRGSQSESPIVPCFFKERACAYEVS